MTKAEFFDIYSRLRLDITDHPPIQGENEERWKDVEALQARLGPIDVELYETTLRGEFESKPLEW